METTWSKLSLTESAADIAGVSVRAVPTASAVNIRPRGFDLGDDFSARSWADEFVDIQFQRRLNPVEFIILNTKFLVYNAQFLVFNTKCIIYTHSSRASGMPGNDDVLAFVNRSGGDCQPPKLLTLIDGRLAAMPKMDRFAASTPSLCFLLAAVTATGEPQSCCSEGCSENGASAGPGALLEPSNSTSRSAVPDAGASSLLRSFASRTRRRALNRGRPSCETSSASSMVATSATSTAPSCEIASRCCGSCAAESSRCRPVFTGVIDNRSAVKDSHIRGGASASVEVAATVAS